MGWFRRKKPLIKPGLSDRDVDWAIAVTDDPLMKLGIQARREALKRETAPVSRLWDILRRKKR